MTHHSYVGLAATWMAMMIAMMAPAAWRWIALFGRMQGSMTAFASGYITAWAPYSVAAAAVQHRALSATGSLPRTLGALVLIGAGLFQFTPLKHACLRHCRNPLTYFLRRWRTGPPSGFRVGLEHGLFCVGCCWALMGTVFAVGLMSLVWMVGLAAVGCVEQLAPGGDRLARGVGAALVVWGVWRLIW